MLFRGFFDKMRGSPGDSFIAGKGDDQRIAAFARVVVAKEPATIFQNDSFDAGTVIGQFDGAGDAPCPAIVAGFAHQNLFGFGAVVAAVRDQSPVAAAQQRGLNRAGADERGGAVPRFAVVFAEGD